MFDFESVSVSSFEAASLAAALTEKSADGWDVVAIVPAGSDVVAYLRRPSAEAAAGESTTESEATADTGAEPTAPAEPIAPAEPAETPAAAELLTTAATNEPVAETAAAASGGTGWGASSDAGAAQSWSSGAGTDSAASSGWSGGAAASTSSWSGQEQQAAAAATPSVPAGWYADPAGRFELRYWDGNAWTEHVSRAGQQYTDPPVA